MSLAKKLCLACLGAINITEAMATVMSDVPPTMDTKSPYLFYLHGKFPEMQGADSTHRLYSKKYETTAIAKSFSDKGYVVITEIRKRDTNIDDYANKVANQIKKLISAGVNPSNISVVGHSKGGLIALSVAGKISSEQIKYAILAGCIRPTATNIAGENPRQEFAQRISNDAPNAVGQMLSLYDIEDDLAYTCKEYVDASKKLQFTEQMLNTGSRSGYGHAIFYAPESKWIDPLYEWLRK